MPPIILNITNIVVDSGNILGSPDPQADTENRTADKIKEYFLPIALLNNPAPKAPNNAPNKALLTIDPFYSSC